MHNQGVIHRDIKGANILAAKEGLVKLADFGVATRLSENERINSAVGTPNWSKNYKTFSGSRSNQFLFCDFCM